MITSLNQKVGTDPKLAEAARKAFQQSAAECPTPILFNKREADGRSTELPLTADIIDTLSLTELRSTHQKRPYSGTSLEVNAWPMLPLTSPIESRIQDADQAARAKEGVWIGKGVWLKQGELPPQTMVIDTGSSNPQYRAYTNQMKHSHGAGTHHLDQVR